MERRKFVLGVGALAAGGAAAVGSGAFTSVRAERTVNVGVRGDSDASLTLTKSGTGPNGQYVDVRDNKATIDLNDSTGSTGLNTDAKVDIFDIFKIRNQGSQPVFVYVDPDSVTPQSVSGDPDGDGNNEYGDAPGVYIDPQFSDRPNAVNFTDGRGAISATGIYGVFDPTTGYAGTNTYDAEDNTLKVGESLDFGLVIDTSGADSPLNFDVSLEIVADADLSGI